MSCVSQEDALLPHVAKEKRATKFKAMASAGCSARAKIMLVRARQRGFPENCLAPEAARAQMCPASIAAQPGGPLASDSRTLVSRMFFYTHTAPVLCEHVPQPAGLRRHLGKATSEQSVLPTVRKRSQTSSRPSQVLARGGARTHPSFSARTSSPLTFPSADPVHL